MTRAKLLLALAAAVLSCAAGPAQAATSNVTVTATVGYSNTLVLDAFDAKDDGYAGPIAGGTLPPGSKYVADVQGNFSYYSARFYYWATPPYTQFCGRYDYQLFGSDHTWDNAAGMDVEWIYGRPGTPTICASLPLPKRWTNFQINTTSSNSAASWKHPSPLGPTTAGPAGNHMYSYPLVGSGAPVKYRLKDLPNIWDNSGRIHITLRPAVDADCANGGYAQFGFSTYSSCTNELPGNSNA